MLLGSYLVVDGHDEIMLVVYSWVTDYIETEPSF